VGSSWGPVGALGEEGKVIRKSSRTFLILELFRIFGRGPSRTMRLLVTGGSGFVLSNIVFEWLSSVPGSSAVVFDLPRAWDVEVRAFLAQFLESGRLDFFAGSVSDSTSWQALENAHGTRFTHIIAGAAITPTVADEKRMAQSILEVNLFGCIHALEFARCCAGQLQRFIFVSSDAVYGHPDLIRAKLPDEATPDTMGLYCLTKFAGESAVARWSELFQIDACCVRFADVYGRLDRNTGARNRHNAPYWVCSHDVGWDYISATDVATAVCAILRSSSPPARPVYTIGIGRAVSHEELLCAVFACVDGEAERPALKSLVGKGMVVQLPADAQTANEGGPAHLAPLPTPHHLRSQPYDISALHHEFGWRPSSLREAVAAYMRWLVEHPPARPAVASL
jgi:UDP-glucose 4-epimerase